MIVIICVCLHRCSYLYPYMCPNPFKTKPVVLCFLATLRFRISEGCLINTAHLCGPKKAAELRGAKTQCMYQPKGLRRRSITCFLIFFSVSPLQPKAEKRKAARCVFPRSCVCVFGNEGVMPLSGMGGIRKFQAGGIRPKPIAAQRKRIITMTY